MYYMIEIYIGHINESFTKIENGYDVGGNLNFGEGENYLHLIIL